MLRKLTDLRGCAIRATDDFIGTVSDFYCDDEDWGVRYLIVDTGTRPHHTPNNGLQWAAH